MTGRKKSWKYTAHTWKYTAHTWQSTMTDRKPPGNTQLTPDNPPQQLENHPKIHSSHQNTHSSHLTIQYDIQLENHTVVLQWIPSHWSILGNATAGTVTENSSAKGLVTNFHEESGISCPQGKWLQLLSGKFPTATTVQNQHTKPQSWHNSLYDVNSWHSYLDFGDDTLGCRVITLVCHEHLQWVRRLPQHRLTAASEERRTFQTSVIERQQFHALNCYRRH